MRTRISSSHLVVISDLHLGNPISTACRRLPDFLAHVAESGADLVVNGDGFDLVQARPEAVSRDVATVVHPVRALLASGARVHYVVGNHDLPLHSLLGASFAGGLVPYLDVEVAGRRVRVEHGHIYDPWYVRSPVVYDRVVHGFGHVVRAVPDTYAAISRAQARKARRAGDTSPYVDAARMLLQRGFDEVVLGHTHRAEVVDLPEGRYVNGGNWAHDATFVEVIDGRSHLRRWVERGGRGMVEDAVGAQG